VCNMKWPSPSQSPYISCWPSIFCKVLGASQKHASVTQGSKGGPLRAGRLEMANIPVHSLHSSCWPSIFCKVLGAIISEVHFGTSSQKHASIPILSVSCVTLQKQVPSIERNLEFQKSKARLKHRLEDVAELVDVPSCVFVKYRKAGCYGNFL